MHNGKDSIVKNPTFYGGEIPFIRIPDLGDGRFIGTVDKTLTAEGLADEEDDFAFKERFTSLRAEFESQLTEEAELNARILSNLRPK